jgi:hypothetical protein
VAPTEERRKQLSLQIRALHLKIELIFPVQAEKSGVLEAAP